MDGIGFAALEAFGGATFETWLGEGDNPWDFLRRLNEVTPKTPVQALIRGQNLLGHRNYADDSVELFVRHAARCGVDVFRVFDPLNDIRNMEVAIRAAKQAGRRVQGALCYAQSPVHNLDLWVSLAKGLGALGVDEVVVKDTSGMLSPQVAWELVASLCDVLDVPVLIHSHCSSGMAPMAYMAAIEAGAGGVDTALSPLAWGTSQPATESVVAALAGGDYDTGLDLDRLVEIKVELEELKNRHREHLSPMGDRIDSDILRYHMPGFMLEDIHRQLGQHQASDRLRDALEEVTRIRGELGHPPLVAPIRQMIASQAVYNVIGGGRYATVTQELKDYLQGLYGRPPQPADPEIRRLVLGREEPITIRPADLLEPQVDGVRAQLRKLGLPAGDDEVLTYLLFPELAVQVFQPRRPEKARKPAADGAEKKEPAVEAVGEAPAGEAAPADQPAPEASKQEAAPQPQTAEFDVEVEGEVFRVRVSGAGFAVAPAAAAGGGQPAASAPPPARAAGDGAVVAPMQGLIVKMPVKVGDEVKLGEVVAVLEAMKMQNDIVATKPGKVTEVYVKEGEVVKPNQPLLSVG
ncbi:MAG: pyruvate carboxylase subunit B [Candidatus Dormibacteraeota bacterium]|nr:pyruvate carboxylase subunit B [Candidatus Dormibacteraeota bacterium]